MLCCRGWQPYVSRLLSLHNTRNDVMSPTPLYIFDLDGTLALIEHRRHMLQWDLPEKWRHFYAACEFDAPNHPVIDTMERLKDRAEIWIFSGRSDEVREKTIAWLVEHTSFSRKELEGPMLTMRTAGDHTADDKLKEQWLHGMLQYDRERLVATFDDRDRVVEMWRRNGVTCFQVAPGEF